MGGEKVVGEIVCLFREMEKYEVKVRGPVFLSPSLGITLSFRFFFFSFSLASIHQLCGVDSRFLLF